MDQIVIIGGGAAGIFSAIVTAELLPSHRVIVLEQSRKLLSKVRISGGGRCNVTHAAYDPKLLAQHYPRGQRELLGPFHRFQPQDTIAWFEQRGVSLKTEADGRIFPVTDSSQTIIDCLLQAAEGAGVEICTQQKVASVLKGKEGFQIELASQTTLTAHSLLIATGSAQGGHSIAESLGHSIAKPVPSLFTFNTPSSPLLDLSGISVADAKLQIKGLPYEQRGPLLITHWGFSGPAALALSSWAARPLYEKEYCVELIVQWVADRSIDQIAHELTDLKSREPKRELGAKGYYNLPLRLWRRLLSLAKIEEGARLSHISKSALRKLAELCCHHTFQVEGKTTYKSEFVTCGGVNLNEVDFKRMESRICPNLYFAGEVLDIDGVTGGFNFQNAWTTGWIAGNAMANHSCNTA